MTDLKLIEKSIMRIPRLKPFFADTVSTKYPIDIVRKVIKKLIKKNKVVSITKGMYVRPKPTRFKQYPYLISPHAEDVKRLIAKKTGEIIIPNQWSALNYVGLSTQIPVRAIYYTSGRSRIIKMKKGRDIRLEHINPKRIVMPGTIVCLVVTALWDKYSKPIHPLSIKKIHECLTHEEYSEIMQNLDKMPERIKCAFIEYQSMKRNDLRLKYWD